MATILTPYLNFAGNAREAMERYQSVFGGTLEVMTFADMGGMGVPEAAQSSVMHSALTVGDGMVLMGSDTVPEQYDALRVARRSPQGFGVTLSGPDLDLLRGYWEGLSEGGTVNIPLEKAPWGDWFGSLNDRFEINWMINIAGSGADA